MEQDQAPRGILTRIKPCMIKIFDLGIAILQSAVKHQECPWHCLYNNQRLTVDHVIKSSLPTFLSECLPPMEVPTSDILGPYNIIKVPTLQLLKFPSGSIVSLFNVFMSQRPH